MKFENKKEIINFIEKLNVGDIVEEIEIGNLNRNDAFNILDEISRNFNIQLKWNFENGDFFAEVAPACKKFLNKEGQYKMNYSKKVQDFLKNK